MQQRRLRLGDILDDYCPRERRITNHAVVAMIEDEVKQTRCTTCDADHEYKHAKAPTPRRRKPDAALTGEVEGTLRRRPAAAEDDVEPEMSEEQELQHEEEHEIDPGEMLADADTDSESVGDDLDLDGESDHDDDEPQTDDDGPVHRRLIRATLPRQNGQTPERKEPEFTVRQPGSGRGGREFDGNKAGFRPGGPGGGRGRRPMRAQGSRPGSGQGGSPGQSSRFGGGGPRQSSGQGQGQGQGQRHGSGQGPRHQGNRPGPPGANRAGGRPPGQGRGPGGGGGRKRGR
jgi:hypothetical protein